jgi:hypothetical protein
MDIYRVGFSDRDGGLLDSSIDVNAASLEAAITKAKRWYKKVGHRSKCRIRRVLLVEIPIYKQT